MRLRRDLPRAASRLLSRLARRGCRGRVGRDRTLRSEGLGGQSPRNESPGRGVPGQELGPAWPSLRSCNESVKASPHQVPRKGEAVRSERRKADRARGRAPTRPSELDPGESKSPSASRVPSQVHARRGSLQGYPPRSRPPHVGREVLRSPYVGASGSSRSHPETGRGRQPGCQAADSRGPRDAAPPGPRRDRRPWGAYTFG